MMTSATELKQKVTEFQVPILLQFLECFNLSQFGKREEMLQRAFHFIDGSSNKQALFKKITELSRMQNIGNRVSQPLSTFNTSTNIKTSCHQSGKLDISAASSAAVTSLLKTNGAPVSTSELTLQELPFYDIVETILKPIPISPKSGTKQQEHQLSFYLSAKQALSVTRNRMLKPQGNGIWTCEHGVQVQLRFCAYDTVSDQPDKYPCNIGLRINNKPGYLPNTLPTHRPNELPRRPGRPVDITSQCRLSPLVANQINVNWLYDTSVPDTNPPLFEKKVHKYAVSLWLVKALNASTLLERLRNKGTRESLFSHRLIEEKLAREEEYGIELSSLRVSLLCPVSRMRMSDPVRCVDCTHMQCFDASVYLQMNERKPTWRCPVCDKPAEYRHLFIDGLTQEILGQASLETEEIEFQQDGSWRSVTKAEDPQDSAPPTVSLEETPKSKPQPAVCQDDSQAPLSKKAKAMEEEDFVIVLDSDDDSETDQAPDVQSNGVYPS